MAMDFGDYGEYSGGFSPDQADYSGGFDLGGWGDFGEYSGGFSPENTQDPGALAASYDLMSNPNFVDPNEGKDKGFSFGNSLKSAGLRGLAGLFGPVGKMGMAAATQDPGFIPGGALSMLGGAMFGPMGMIGGGLLGSAAGKGLPGYAGGPAGLGGPNGMDGNEMAQTLMQLYGASRANDGAGGVGSMNTAVQDQVKRLSEIYGPNSPYAAQMRQTLARKDAAAGRNSQYGPREAQLAALLAEKQTQATDAMSRAATGGQANALALAKYKQQLMGQRLGLAANIGKRTGLFNIFGSGGHTPPLSPINNVDFGLASSLVSNGNSFAGGNLADGATFTGGGSGGSNWFDSFLD